MAAGARAPKSTVFSVSQLNRLIKEQLESSPVFAACYVTGEISNFKHHSSGHMYLTLKDEHSRLRAVMFAGKNRSLRFRPEDGMRVICMGSIGVFDRDGQYQLYIEDMQPDGIGALYIQFEQLRDRLQQEGLFAPARKRPLPVYPRRVGVVTSATGAVIRDIYTTLERRYPLAKIVLAPAAVQGPGAARTLVNGLERLWALRDPVDVIIIGRGGGSLEELWPFNEEVVARAIARSPIPVVSAVGHETDVTICDFVADVRAATPTAAAELVAPHRQDILIQLVGHMERAGRAIRQRITRQQEILSGLRSRPVLRQPARIVQVHRQSVDLLQTRIRDGMTRQTRQVSRRLEDVERRMRRVDFHRQVVQHQHNLERLADKVRDTVRRGIDRKNAQLIQQIGMLEAMNPLAVLRRGYSVAYDEHETKILSNKRDFQPGERIVLQVSDGKITAQVVDRGEYLSGKQTRLDI